MHKTGNKYNYASKNKNDLLWLTYYIMLYNFTNMQHV